MKRYILRGALILAAALPALLAQPKPKSQEELQALKTMFEAQTADAKIAACENVLTKFADTEFKAIALYFEAAAYKQKNDYEHAVVFGERTLEADPKQFQAMFMLATLIAGHTKEFDLDREEKLGQVEKYVTNGLELLKDAPKPNAAMTDEQWVGFKKDLASDGHAALAMGAVARKKYDLAETEFKTSIEIAEKPDPWNIIRLGRTYTADHKYDDAIAVYDKVMANADASAQVRQTAQADRARIWDKRTVKPAAPGTPASPAPQAQTPKP